jgi:hypothetical protein
MGSDETANTIPGGPRVIDVFYGNETPSGPNCLLFSDADRLSDSLWDRSGVGWSPTPHAPVLGALQRALDPKPWQFMVQSNRAQRTLLIYMHRWKPPRVRVGACACIVQTLSELRETSGPRIDRIPPTRPSWRDRQYRELKKLVFSAPSTCPIGLFGPVANRTILK